MLLDKNVTQFLCTKYFFANLSAFEIIKQKKLLALL